MQCLRTIALAVHDYHHHNHPDLWYHPATEAVKNVAVILKVLYVKLGGLCCQFYFPVPTPPDYRPWFLRSNDWFFS